MKFKKMSNLSSVTRTKSALLWAMMAVLFFSFSDRGYASVNEVNEIATVSQQGRAVTGRIVDQTGEPVIGATVIEIGSNPINGTITNFDGEFTLNLTTSAPALNVAFIGFEEMTVNVGNQSVINLVMQEYASFLDEIVVIGYGTARRADLTGAISTIRVDNAMLAAAPRSVFDLLRDNAPGLHIPMSTTAEGYAGTGMLIRGDNSLLANSAPLLVLDGVIFQGSMSDINPHDIATIAILKDASSAAVFGARAAGGVIAMTTHRGARGGRPRINVNTNVGFVERGPRSMSLMSPDEFLSFRSAALNRDLGGPGWDGLFLQDNPQHFSDPRNLQGGLSQLDWFNQGGGTATSVTHEELMRAWGGRLRLGAHDTENLVNWRTTDWEDLVFRTGFQQEHNISVSNRTDDMSIFWSMGYTDREGFLVGDHFTAFRTRLNMEMTITPFLRVGLHAGFASRDQGHIPAAWAYNTNRVRLSPFAANFIGDESVPEILWRNPAENTPDGVNPLYDRMHISRRDMRNHFDANMFAVVSLPLGIEYQVNFVTQNNFRERMNHQHTTAVHWRTGIGNVSYRQHWRTFAWQVDNILRWNERFGIHHFDVTLLANAERTQTWMTRAEGREFEPTDMLGFHLLNLATDQRTLSDDTYVTGDALMGRLSYNLLDRYMLTATVRRDGYSAFGMNNPRGTFASFAGGWTFTSEPWAESFNHIMDFGRLRASWGENGNRDIAWYAALAGLNWLGHTQYVDGAGQFITLPNVRVGRMANHDLRWERTAAVNLGLDFSFIGRIRGSLEVYHMMTNDLLINRPLPNITGFTNVTANLGQMQNRGFEASMTYDVVRNRNFTWTTTGAFSLNRRKIVSLFGEVDGYGNEADMPGSGDHDGWWIGQDPSVIWAWQSDGVWQLHEAEMAARWGRRPGDFRYLPADGRIPQEGSVYTLTADDRVFLGHRDPRFRWAWTNSFTLYRDWSITTRVNSLWGHYGAFNMADNAYLPMTRTQWSQPFWTPDNPINDFAAVGSNNSGTGATQFRSRSHIRLENITVSYNIPRNVVQRLSVQNARLSASVNNVAVWAPHWPGGDPGFTGTTPAQRTYNFSVNFTL